MTPYIHRVHYYETDRMGITHHSNYIRMMEEARVDFLEQLGWPYARMEELGVTSPVTALNMKFLAPTTFDDRVEVRVGVKSFNGVTLVIRYEMIRQGEDPVTVLTGESEHVFLNREGHFVRMKREMPEFVRLLSELAEMH
ncbi:MAG: acyl-CoA thioesterase [Aristaeellaceae bacterium]